MLFLTLVLLFHFSVLRLDSQTLFLFRLDCRPSESISPSISILTGLSSLSTEIVLTSNQPFAVNNGSPFLVYPDGMPRN
jgi:hypothetical protein